MGKAWDGMDIERRHATVSSTAEGRARTGIAAAAGKYDLAPAAMKAFQRFSEAWAAEAFRVLKPGGLLLSFASPRTYHRMAAGLEDAGVEIRDQIMWVFGSGFPKSHNGVWGGTAAKPAHEPVALARKPLQGTVAQNYAKWGTGGINIDACRIGVEAGAVEVTEGRWPANLIHDGSDVVINAFPRTAPSRKGKPRTGAQGAGWGMTHTGAEYSDAGTAARFFYCAKASTKDREAGLAAFRKTPAGMVSNTSGQHITRRDGYELPMRANIHPTVKPTDLMRYLCRMVTPAGGVVLDPFAGSGSTGRGAALEGFRFVGAELDPAYAAIARARILDAARHFEALRQRDLALKESAA
jgi:site-specific DNA-methyltransferase (adenine-specific)